jgi:hypothetical protein
MHLKKKELHPIFIPLPSLAFLHYVSILSPSSQPFSFSQFVRIICTSFAHPSHLSFTIQQLSLSHVSLLSYSIWKYMHSNILLSNLSKTDSNYFLRYRNWTICFPRGLRTLVPWHTSGIPRRSTGRYPTPLTIDNGLFFQLLTTPTFHFWDPTRVYLVSCGYLLGYCTACLGATSN